MSIHINYLTRVVQDLSERVHKVVVNGIEAPISDVSVNGRELIVSTERMDDVTRITSVRLLDELGNVIITRNPNRNTEGNRSIEFRFEIEVE